MRSQRRRGVAATLAGLTTIALICAGTIGASAAEEPVYGTGISSSVEYIVQGGRLEPVEEQGALRVSSVEQFDGYSVTFSLDDQSNVVAKQIELHAAPLPPNTEGRDKLATYSANSDGHVVLEWWDPSDGQIQWSVRRDDEVVATTNSDRFEDQRPGSNQETTYEISGVRLVDVNGTTAEEPFSTVISVPAIDTTPIGSKLDADSLSPAANTDVMSSAAGEWTMTLQFNTFIPSRIAETPFDLQPCIEAYGGNGVGYYGDDNRGFADIYDPAPSVRTGLQLTREYNAIGLRVGGSSTTRTSGTYLYNPDGSVLATRNADLSSIQNLGAAGDEHGGSSTWGHSVADPLCSVAPTIDYTMTLGSWGDGRYRLYGDHDQAPSYEFRVKSTDQFYNVYTFDNRGLQYLLPGFPPVHVERVGGVNAG